MTNKVTPAETPDQPDHFAEIAAELRRAADDIETLVGSGLPKPTHVALDIHPGGPRLDRDDDQTARAVDALGRALLGKPGTAQKMYDDSYHYGTESTQRGPIKVHVYDSVSTAWAVKHETAASLAAKEAELERLRAEVIALRAAAALQPDADASGLGYSREADDPTPVSGARMPHHESGGWKGTGPGSCGVECACGVVFDGFDTLVAAAEQLARHIEAATAGPKADHRTCVDPGDQEHDHAMCEDVVAEEQEREPVHYRFGMHDTACGLKPGEVLAATADHAKVTCKACVDGLPF